MFYHINGVVTDILPQLAVVDCGGIGFALNSTNNTLAHLKLGEKAKIFTYVYIREDSMDLYGFYTQEEKRLFEMLLGVSGVGPKAALSVLSSSTPESLALSIISGDDKALTMAQGIGKKTAQRIILELKDKMAKETNELSFSGAASAPVPAAQSGKLSDAVSALMVLGYSQAEINAALKHIDTEQLGLEVIIKQALREMMK